MITRLTKLLIVLPVFLLATLGKAHAVPHDIEAFASSYNYIAIDEARKHQIYVETSGVYGKDLSHPASATVRLAYDYSPNKYVSLFLGYTHAVSLYDGHYKSSNTIENNVWEQVVIKQDVLGVQVQHRLRQEQRILEGKDGVLHRTRYQVKATKPLTESGKFGVTAYNEVFINLNGDNKGYEKDQVAAGVFLKEGNTKYELGVVAEHNANFGGDDRVIVGPAFSTTIDW